MSISIYNVNCLVSNTPFGNNETLFDCIDIDLLVKNTDAKFIDVYCKDLPHEPIKQWIIDFRNNEGVVLCVKYPSEIPDDEMIRFVNPVINYFKKLRNH